MSQSSFGQNLLCMFNSYITVCSGKIKNRKLCIWPIFTCINKTFDTGHPIHVNWLPLRVVRLRNSVYFVVRFPISDERTGVTWQENSIGVESESLLTGTTQPYLVILQELHSGHYLCTLCYWTTMFTVLKSHYPHNSIYPHPCWDDSNYSYPSLIHKGTNVCGHSAIYRKLIVVEWVSVNKKK